MRTPAWCVLALLASLLCANSPAGDPHKLSDGKELRVIVINFDPILKTRGNLRLHEYMKWSDPWALTDKMVEDAKVASHGYVNYCVVDKLDYDGFPVFRNGFSYTEESFLRMWEKDRDQADKSMTSFK